MFNNIDGHLSTIFSKVQNVDAGFNLASKRITDYINIFNSTNTTQAFDDKWDKFIDNIESKNKNLANYFKDLAKEGASARANIEDVYAAILNGNTKGVSNVKSIITEFNKLGNNAEGQQAFAAAVGQTNQNLGKYLTGLNGASASMRGYAGELVTSTIKTAALEAATLALNAAVTIGIATAISTVIRKFSDMANAYQQNIDKMNELSGQVKSIEGEIESLNSELKEGVEKLHELEAIETPNLFEQAEIDRLKEYNEELERQIRLKKYDLQEANDKANEASQKYIDSLDFGVNPFEDTEWWEWLLGSATGGLYWVGKTALDTGSEVFQGNTYDQKISDLNQYEKEIQTYQKILDEYNKFVDDHDNDLLSGTSEIRYKNQKERYENSLKAKKESIGNYEKDLYNDRKDFEGALLGLDQNDPNNKDNIQKLQDFIDRYDKIRSDFNNQNNKGNNDFLRVYENADFTETVTQLESLAKKGKLTEDTFNRTNGIDAFKDALSEVEITDIDFVIDSIIQHVTDTGDSFENAESSLFDFKETLDNTFANQSTIQSAFDKIQQGSSLSADEVRKLVELCPSLANAFTKTSDGYTIDAKRLIEANENLTQSTKDSLTEQLDSLKALKESQEEQLNQLANTSNQIREADVESEKLREDMSNTEEQIALIELSLSMLGVTASNILNHTENLSEAFSKLTSKAKTLSSALKEQDEAGTLSADTIMNIVDAGYASALVFDQVTGKVTINKDAYLQLAKAEYDEQIANLETVRSLHETSGALSNIASNTNVAIGGIYGIANAFLEVQKSIADTPEQIAEIDARIAALKTARDNVGNYDTGTTTDPIKAAFEEEMKDIEHLHNMGLISEEDYYDALEKANENHYKDSLEHESEYLSNKEKIYNGRKNLYKEDVDKQVQALQESFDEGFITAKELRSELQKLAETKYGIGTIYFGTEFASENYADLIDKAKNVGYDIYKEELEKIKEAEDGTLETHQKVVEKWKNLNSKMFEGIDPRKYKENLEEIEKADQDFLKDYVDKQVSGLEEAFDKGFITAEELRSKLQNLADMFYGEGTIYFGTEFASENYSSIIDKVNDTNNDVYKERLDELKKADDGSLESHKEFIENWKQLAFEMFAGVDPKKYKEILDEIDKEEEDFWNDRVEKEKEYWENQKQAVIDYYDEEIKKLEDIADEEERINKQEELRLNLIKAQQDLLNAKKNRNQLVFSNGGFEYTYDQEAVESASEAVKNAEKDITDYERDQEIELLKEQKENEEKYYDQILEIIGFYIKKSVPLTESDKEVFDDIMNSPYAKYANQETQINPKAELPQEQKQSNESKSSEDKSESKSKSEPEIDTSKFKNMDFSIFDAFENYSVEGMMKFINFVGESAMKEAQYPMWGQFANPVYNNSTITTNNNNNDNKQITIGDIHVNVQGGTSDEMINEFSQKLSAALAECATREIYSKNKR